MVLIFYRDLLPLCIAMPTADRIRFNRFAAAFMNYASHGEKRHVMDPAPFKKQKGTGLICCVF